METLPSDDRAPAPARRGIPRGVWWGVALAIVVLAVAGLKATSSHSSSADSPSILDPNASQPAGSLTRPSGQSPVGQKLPAAAFDRFDGTSASFADYAGRPMVVNFWSSTCTPCVKEMPDLEAVHQQYADRVAFVGVDVQDTLANGQRMAATTGVTYDLVRDPDASLIGSVGGTDLPITLLVRSDGTVVRLTGPGAVKPDDLRHWIDQDLLS